MEIEIEYDGVFPDLCGGHLIVTINGQIWDFGEDCLLTGGSPLFYDDFDPDITYGQWSINEWPEGFPEELKDFVIEAVNDHIPHGCCGGCV